MDDIVRYELPENITKEFSVNEKGYGFVSRRGVARLSGVSHTAINKLIRLIETGNPGQSKSIKTPTVQGVKGGNQRLPKNLRPFAGQSFNPDQPIPDLLASAIIKYYSRQGKEIAQDTDDALGAVGLRQTIRNTLGWQPQPTLTDRQIVEMLCLPVPTQWQPRFSVEFYHELQRLTGLTPMGHKRPVLWAKITKELIYDYLPKGVYEELKAWQLATDSSKKLHQFLSLQGTDVLREHMKRVITLMQCAAHLSEVERMLGQSISKTYQQNLFDK